MDCQTCLQITCIVTFWECASFFFVTVICPAGTVSPRVWFTVLVIGWTV
ncbi:hypothetical protein SORBI_3004G113201 [Sorghum bicolor]|uniref:Uncharacterized protein n=1 Tax=Sorghum bicolor TaxID=4558 RepID=A0A1Z5RMC9_SORBI|nr:hypothetical protein SORBI_3004G113201 [Sorghum bicolor]